MASADELIREAQYAFRNISHGSTDASKYRARAKKYAKQVIRKFPGGIEATQARSILAQMNVRIDVQSPDGVSPQRDAAADFEKSHSKTSGHNGRMATKPVTPDTQFQLAGSSEDVRSLIRRFIALPRSKKRIFGIVAVVAVLFPGGLFAISGLVVFYGLQPVLLKKHLNTLLSKLESD